MNRRQAIVFVLIALGLLLVYWTWWHPRRASAQKTSSAVVLPAMSPSFPHATPTNLQSPVVNFPNVPGHPLSNADKQNVSKIVQTFSAPISFWGKVIDQSKQPVDGANIHYEAIDRYFGPSTAYQGASDQEGFFSISGIGGAGLYVRVSKDGYYQLGEKSMRGFHTGSGDMPSRDNPAIFELRKRGQTEDLIVKGIGHNIASDGTPIQLNLATGPIYKLTNAQIQLQVWANDAAVPVNSGERYDWRCKITVPGGGLQTRTDQFNFEAPTEGYKPSDEIDMTVTSDQWRQQAQRGYFVQLANGDYARMDFQIMTGGNHIFRITSYLNPIPGHTNLEYDPNQQALK